MKYWIMMTKVLTWVNDNDHQSSNTQQVNLSKFTFILGV